eukprot:COSAG01_NODE_54906_length_329_cov_0.526087_1_plen_21_part_01
MDSARARTEACQIVIRVRVKG